jgi:orotate phosphoribosyltransferase
MSFVKRSQGVGVQDFVRLLVETGALRFGSFVTKSGRESPFFMNFGAINLGADLSRLARWYADSIVRSYHPLPDVIFGPAYKGIPLAVAIAMELAAKTGQQVGFAFDRKETKGHGEGGNLVGHPLADGCRVVVIDDVLTAGTSAGQTLAWMKELDVTLAGVLVGVDRCERASDALGGEGTAASALAKRHGVRVDSLTDIKKILEMLAHEKSLASASGLTDNVRQRITEYLGKYGP